jgi:cytochrome c-type biogenesis protein CcmH/NrfG
MKDSKDSEVVLSKGIKKRFKPSRKQVVLSGAIVLLLAAIAGSVFLFTRHRTSTADDKVATAIKSANQSMDNADYKSATATLKAVENLPASKQDKVAIYSMLGSSAMVQNLTGDVNTYYQKKHDLDPTTAKADALNLATYYQRTGETQKAIDQYRIAIAYLQSQPDNITRSTDLDTANARLQELGVQP